MVLILYDAGRLLKAVCKLPGVHGPHRKFVQPLHQSEVRLHRKFDNVFLQHVGIEYMSTLCYSLNRSGFDI